MSKIKETFNELSWESKEFEWEGKSFFFITYNNLVTKITGLGGKLTQVNRELRQNGYHALNNIILIEYVLLKGRIMVEVEKLDKYDAQVMTFDEGTTVDTVVHKGPPATIGREVKRLRERVASRRGREPRSIFYWLVSGIGSERSVIFAIT